MGILWKIEGNGEKVAKSKKSAKTDTKYMQVAQIEKNDFV